MRTKNKSDNRISKTKKGFAELFFAIVFFALFLVLQFVMNRSMHFINDDIWYSTNLVTGEKISSVSDIIESQIWHFYNWGGRNITHALLQAVETGGELFADVVNTLMTIGLCFVICRLADVKKSEKVLFALLGNVMLIGLNPASFMNMFWQSGAVNYLYSTVWIFLFVSMYLEIAIGTTEHTDNHEKNRIIPDLLTFIAMAALGIITGWSNENMGPASLVITAGVTVYLLIKDRTRVKPWMIGGVAGCLFGSMMVVLAPGNFVRSSLIKENFWEAIANHFAEIMRATFNYLFPVIIVSAMLIFVYVFVLREKLSSRQHILLAYFGLAHGAMIISPTYPSRATFGVLAILVAFNVSVLNKIREKTEKSRIFVCALTMGFYISSVVSLVYMIKVPPIQ